MHIPTDREVLRCIYDRYKCQYPGETAPDGKPTNDPYVPIDINTVAADLRFQPELLFGRIYYHLDAKYRYKQPDNVSVSLFQLNLQGRKHCIQFPYLASILAALEEERRRHFWTLGIAILALAISIAGILIQFATIK